MIWQDAVIGACTFGFLVSLVPQVIRCFTHGTKSLSLFTASTTTALLYVMAVTMYTLKLPIGATVNLLTATCWMVMFVKRLRDFCKERSEAA